MDSKGTQMLTQALLRMTPLAVAAALVIPAASLPAGAATDTSDPVVAATDQQSESGTTQPTAQTPAETTQDEAKPSWEILEPANTGIPGDYVYSVAVDAKGRPWATGDDPFWDEGGLGQLRGGKKWRQWTNVDGKSPHHFLRNIHFDDHGRPWAASPAGLLRLAGGKVKTVWSAANAPWPTSFVRDFDWDSEGNLWVALADPGSGAGGVGRYADGRWKVWTGSSGLPFGPGWDRVDSLEIDDEDRVWIGSPIRGAAVFENRSWRGLGEPQGSYYDITIAPDGTPWFASDRSGVYTWEDDAWVRRSDDDFGTGSILKVQVDRDDRIWITTAIGSIWRWSGEGDEWDQVIRPPMLQSHIYALDFTLDNEPVVGGIGGMAILHDGGHWSWYTVESTGLPARFLYDVSIGDSGRTWVATSTGGVGSTNGRTWTNFNKASAPWPFDTDSAAAVLEAPDGTLWAAPSSHGVARWDGEQWTGYLPGVTIESITVDSHDRVWIAPDRGQAMRFNGSTFVEMGNPPTGADLNDLAADDAGNVWLASGAGLFKYDGDEWTTYYAAGAGFPSDGIYAVTPDPDHAGVVWVGTDAGLARFDGTSSKVYTVDDGLPANWIQTIAVAPNGKVWVGAYDGQPFNNGGVAVLSGSRWKAYTPDDSPLPNTEVLSIDIGADGRVWVATALAGLAIITP